MNTMTTRAWAALLFTGIALASVPVEEAHACGGMFTYRSTTAAVATDHRIALSVSDTETVMWDQITYTGAAAEFAWVLPVHAGTTVELSDPSWFAALEQATAVELRSNVTSGRGVGCGSADVGASPPSRAGNVAVVSEHVVGPYDVVTLRGSDPNALLDYLEANGFEVTPAAALMLRSHIDEGLDFLCVRLRAGCDSNTIQPVRVIAPGSDPTIATRMFRAGAGASVRVTLFVLADARYEAANFPNQAIDQERVELNGGSATAERFTSTLNAQMADADGRTWVTTYANDFTPARDQQSGASSFAYSRALGSSYRTLCSEAASDSGSPSSTTCATPNVSTDSGVDDAGTSDAGDPSAIGGAQCDDYARALRTLSTTNVWLTRMEANLPEAALDRDLLLQKAPNSYPVFNTFVTSKSATDGSCSTRSLRTPPVGVAIVTGAIIAAMRRRGRKRRAT